MPRTIAPDRLDFTEHVREGEMLCWSQASAEPLTLTETLMRQRHRLGGISAFVGIGWAETIDPAHCDAIRFLSYCGAGRNRLLHAANGLDILPIHYSQFGRFLSDRIDVLFLQLAPGRERGSYSYGLACEYLRPLVKTARLVIAEVNDQVPPTPCLNEIPADDLDVIVPTSRPLPAPPEARPGDLHRMVAGHVATLVPDGATLQVGIGGLPAAILDALKGHRHLGVHSGLFVDGFARLMESGVVDNSRKPIDTGYCVAGLIAGTDITHEICRTTDLIRLASTDHTHAIGTLARIDRFTAINSALEVDLTGQINSEMAGRRYVGAVGGGTDFMRGAMAAEGGLPIIALPSSRTGRDGEIHSSIVIDLNGPVSITRADAGVIVTEYGIADLRGASLSQRARALLDVAHPDLREALERRAHECGLLSN